MSDILPQIRSITLPPDLALIASMVPENQRVLDIGCGNGELLGWLKRHKKVDGRGIEIDRAGIRNCLSQGLAVIQGDANNDLIYYPDNSFDLAILSKTLQMMQDPREVLRQMMRVAQRSIVSVPNFGHWKNRLYLLTQGRMPVTSTLSYQWYDTPNIHFCTIRDFVVLCDELGFRITDRYYLKASGEVARFGGKGPFANVFGEQGIFLISRI